MAAAATVAVVAGVLYDGNKENAEKPEGVKKNRLIHFLERRPKDVLKVSEKCGI